MAIVTVTDTRYTVDSLYQWDTEQVLEIYGLSLSSVPSIHFTNQAMDRAIVRAATMDASGVISVNIPNSLLQTAYKITAYVCIYEGDTFQSLYAIVIPVKARTKPSDYTITDEDEEIYSFNALENLVNNAIYYVDNEIANVEKNFAPKTHVTDKQNPHGVTADQVGAVPTAGGKMTGTLNMNGQSLTGLPNAVNDTDALALAFGKTLFAPSGYVDESAVRLCIPYINGKTITFSVASTSKGSRLPLTIIVSTQSGSKGIIQMNVLGSNGAPINQATVYGPIGISSIIYSTEDAVTTYTITIDTNGYSICQVLSVNPVTALVTAITEGTSMEYEYQNPPMALGVEYRTTERWQGKVVYTKLVNCGNLPSNGSQTSLAHGASATQIIQCYGQIIVSSHGGGDPLPYNSKDYGEIVVTSSLSTIRIYTKSWIYSATDPTNLTCTVQLKYTKD